MKDGWYKITGLGLGHEVWLIENNEVADGYKASEFEELGIVFEPVMVLTTIEYKTKLAEAFDAGYRKAETAGVWW